MHISIPPTSPDLGGSREFDVSYQACPDVPDQAACLLTATDMPDWNSETTFMINGIDWPHADASVIAGLQLFPAFASATIA
jgi:hypothetical protein